MESTKRAIATHYGVEIKTESFWSLNKSVFEFIMDYLSQQGYPHTLLPICPQGGRDREKDMYIEVIRYEKDGETRYAITCEETERYYTMPSLPDDMDIPALIRDVDSQIYEKKKPQKMESKFYKIMKEANMIAYSILTGTVYKKWMPLPMRYEELIREYDRQHVIIGQVDYRGYDYYKEACEKIAQEKPELFYDGEDVYVSIITESLLEEKGYSHGNMVRYASVCDDMDADEIQKSLERLEIASNWRYYTSWFRDSPITEIWEKKC